MTNQTDKHIEALAVKCGATLRESGCTANPKRMFSITSSQLQSFANKLTKPQDAVGYISINYDEHLEGYAETPVGSFNRGNDLPVYLSQPNHVALLNSIRQAMKHSNLVLEHTDWSLMIKEIDEAIGEDNG